MRKYHRETRRWWRKISERCVKAENKINFVVRSPISVQLGESLPLSASSTRSNCRLFAYFRHAAKRNGFIFREKLQHIRITLVIVQHTECNVMRTFRKNQNLPRLPSSSACISRRYINIYSPHMISLHFGMYGILGKEYLSNDRIA